MTAFLVSEQLFFGIMGTFLIHWSHCALLPTCVPQHLAAGQSGVPPMWVPRVIPRFWLAFSGLVRSL